MSSRTDQHLPEILAPGGDLLSVRAALDAGTDAVYLGLSAFNARRKAANITERDLPDLVLLAHERGVRIYITANILIPETEIRDYCSFIAFCMGAGVDGFIIADPGVLSLIPALFPEAEIHASTQMTTHNTAQIAFLRSFGVDRVNLSRELTLSKVGDLTGYAHGIGIETEVFVHGAYCISFSGQCFMSSFLGGESGNRGICFQPCRRRYTPISDCPVIPGNLLSLKDNNAISLAGDLVRAGVDSLKIEGRMKGHQYVHTLVSAWRRRLDTLGREEENADTYDELSGVFNRGFSVGYARGRVGPDMFVESPFDLSCRQEGRVLSYRADTGILKATCRLMAPASRIMICTEDNLLVCMAMIEESLPEPSGGAAALRIRIVNELKGKILPGQIILSDDSRVETPGLVRRLEAMKPRKIPLHARLSGRNGEPLVLELTAEGNPNVPGNDSHTVSVESSVLLSGALKAPLTIESVRAQIGRLGDTPFALESCSFVNLDEKLFLPVKELNDMRRRGIALLGYDPGRFACSEIPRAFPDLPEGGLKTRNVRSHLALLFSDPADAAAFRGVGADILLEAGDPGCFPSGQGIIPWFPLITREEDLEDWKALLGRTEEPCVSGNTGIGYLAGKEGIPWVAGPGFNSVNSWAFRTLMARGATGAVVSPELSRDQIYNLTAPPDFSLWMHVLGPILLMTTRQCLMSHELQSGGCGKSCTDRECYTGCSRHLDITGSGGGLFHIVKSPRQETRIFNDPVLWLPEAVIRFRGRIDRFILDFRDFPFYTLSRRTKTDIVEFFSALLEASGVKNGGGFKPPFPATGGLYRRGLT